MKTIKKECNIEFEERKSKFIGYIKPVFTKEEAEDFINSIKIMHPNATHNCSTYKINNNGLEFFKYDDDGEPSGTAGKPMGDIITYMGVNNLAIVATRYFGGIKLGAGGLVRNYAKTAKLAIYEAEIIDFINKKTYLLEFNYEMISDIDNLLTSETCEFLDKDFGEKVLYKIKIDDETFSKIENIHGLNIIEL